MASAKRSKGSQSSLVSYFRFPTSPAAEFDLNGADLERVHAGIVDGKLPSNVLHAFRVSTGFTIDEMARVIGMSPRTIARKERSTSPLSPAEADRAVRLSRVVHAAVYAIGDRDKALRWLRKPNTALRGHVPLELIATEPGTQIVVATLNAIAYGGVV
jgi:putative toxin-antitoxin system antitoxin component (TIGR02293 family)